MKNLVTVGLQKRGLEGGGYKQYLQVCKKLSHRKEIILVYIILEGRTAHCFYKLLTMTYKVLHDLLLFISFTLLPISPPCSLQSSHIGLFIVPCGDQAQSYLRVLPPVPSSSMEHSSPKYLHS